MNTPQTDTPETEMTLQEQLIAAHRRIGIEHTEMQVQRDRALAAEAMVKELEAALRLRPIAEAGPVPEGMIAELNKTKQ
jgi:hypothetical protein